MSKYNIEDLKRCVGFEVRFQIFPHTPYTSVIKECYNEDEMFLTIDNGTVMREEVLEIPTYDIIRKNPNFMKLFYG